MYRWTHKRAAWYGFRLGRGASLESVLRDRRIGAQSEQALRGVATRWGLTFGNDNKSPPLAVSLPPADQEILAQAAEARGLSVASFAATLIHTIARERLFSAVLDDDR
jgi:hypothetical protein